MLSETKSVRLTDFMVCQLLDSDLLIQTPLKNRIVFTVLKENPSKLCAGDLHTTNEKESSVPALK